ncbi:TetR family transcriptional regulator [Pseudomonas sp. CFBP 8770]|uniref:TetR family transcriptional regulator n=1 Tax=unclassified Pseudomonas TaxID=196821 RepID=UPI00177AC8B5|nr:MULTISPECIES: TetR family transcriptional regulator [unclassified Pseudomonas]MBD8476259.1 TetR family transcriptional regulator [Pseudomonas sp. CFBP 8773]MBD8649041.1 TetR family transcriptional regulator [Pseudomonas sp. CFBP 8770]
MKVSKAQAQANRAHIVETASTLFRERGYDGVSVADLMAAAGFTHGGFYKHFRSKSDLMSEAAACGFAQMEASTGEAERATLIERYLSREHRDAPGDGCTLAALSADAARQPEEIKAVFAQGMERLLAKATPVEPDADEVTQQTTRAERINALAHLVGALMLSRACPDDSALADEILESCRAHAVARVES